MGQSCSNYSAGLHETAGDSPAHIKEGAAVRFMVRLSIRRSFLRWRLLPLRALDLKYTETKSRTKAVPKLNRYRKKGSPYPLLHIKDEHEKERIKKALYATEGYILFSSIAMGIIQMLCLRYGTDIRASDYRYLRTASREVMSEASMMTYLRRNLFRFMAGKDNLTITKIITSSQIPFEEDESGRLVS